jgi:cation diffusion facilitator CzcD-associated flavoprotein CzcO
MSRVDVLIVGAGISGIGAAYHLQTRCPDRTYAIVESRERIGGTWDLFRFPGIRSDSDMHTLGYAFRPWDRDETIADGASIRRYVEETAEVYGIREHIRFQHRVTGASWSSEQAEWTVSVTRMDTGEELEITCNFLFMCSGYYDYEQGYTPQLEGAERFEGQIVHPQKWTSDIDYEGKRVVVIGSGATAITLVPALAEKAAHVTMLQRSPSYVLALPMVDEMAVWLRRKLPRRAAYHLTRWRNIAVASLVFRMSKRDPERMKRWLIGGAKRALGRDFDVKTHFTPRYDPWDERLCVAPGGDLFMVIREGRASVVTDHIDTFTEKGLRLRSGKELEADLVVTATGLNLLFMAGIEVVVDGERVDMTETLSYKAMMFSDVPNLALSTGYTNASWTLKAELTAKYVCRLLNHMKRGGYRRCVPRQNDPTLEEVPFMELTSGYIRRALDRFPKQGDKPPWRLQQSYARDAVMLRYGRVDDGVMEFS